MKIREIITLNELFGPPTVTIPLATYNQVKPIIQQQQNAARNQPPMTQSQKVAAARRAKINQLTNRFKQSEIRLARTKPSEEDIALAMRQASESK